jgi:hypothetical protein
MSFIPVPNTAEIVFNQVLSGKPVTCVLAASHTGSITTLNMTNLGQAILDGLFAFLTAGEWPGTTNIELVSIKLVDLTSSSSPVVFVTNGTGSTPPLPWAGSDGGTVLSQQDCSVVTWQTVARGRSFRGRTFLAGLPQTQLASSDAIKPTYMTFLDGFWLAIHDSINAAEGGTWTHCVISRFASHVARPSGITTPISTLRVNSYIGSQNRRR